MAKDYLLYLGWIYCISVNWYELFALFDISDGTVGLRYEVHTPLNLRSFLELKAIRGFR